MFRHAHLHKRKRQKVICPFADDCKANDNNSRCSHGIEHVKRRTCWVYAGGCPECIKTQEVIEEETFTREEFAL